MNNNLKALTSGNVWFATWSDDKKSAFSFSFDDGFISHYENVRPILNQFNLNGTFYVLPPFLTEDPNDRIWRYGTWPMFIEMGGEGHEIGSHTMNHLHLTQREVGSITQDSTILYELYQAQDSINKRLPDQKCVTMAYPYAEHNSLVDSLTGLYYESARADGLLPNPSSITDSLWYKLRAIEVLFSGPRTYADDMVELQFLKDWIDSSVSNNAWGILLAHEVVPQDSLPGLIEAGSWNPYSNEWFTLLCDWVNTKSTANDVWVETIANVTRYIKERDNALISALTLNEQQIQFAVEDNLDDEIFDFPITTFISVPQSWEFALFSQDGKQDTLEVFQNDSGYVVIANVVPNGSTVTLDKLNSTGVNDVTFIVDFRLYQNYPNPFNPSTTIHYSVAERGRVKITVYDILGKEIRELVDEEKSPGYYSVVFDGHELSSGVYFYTLSLGNQVETRKMVITK